KDYLSWNGTRTYDAENRMITANNGTTDNYGYDGDGHRVKRIGGGTETWQVYGVGAELLAEYAANTPASSPQKEYGYRNGQLLITAASASAAPSGLAAAPASSGTNIALSWSGSASNYRIERKAAGGSFGSIGSAASPSF